MAAAAAAAGATIGSCYSTAATTTSTCRLTTKYSPTSDSVLRIACNLRTQQPSSLSHSHYSLHDLLNYKFTTTTSTTTHKWRKALRICATVEQEQVSSEEAATKTESSVVDDSNEEEQTNQETGEDQGEEDTSNKEGAINTKLYFGNLPYNCDSSQLAGIIQEYGSPEMVEVLYDRDTGRSRGFAFVTMSSIEDANAVIQNLDGSEYGGRTLKVNFSDKPKPKEPLYPETDYKLFVGNLSWSVTSESLIQAFEEYGNVVGARVLYDGDTGRSRGYGFVCYSSKQEMDAALVSLNGVELEGRAMRVSLAQGKRN